MGLRVRDTSFAEIDYELYDFYTYQDAASLQMNCYFSYQDNQFSAILLTSLILLLLSRYYHPTLHSTTSSIALCDHYRNILL